MTNRRIQTYGPKNVNPTWKDKLAVLFSAAGENRGIANIATLSRNAGTFAGTVNGPVPSAIGPALSFRTAAADGSIYFPTQTDLPNISFVVHFFVRGSVGATHGIAQWADTSFNSPGPRLLLQNNNGDLRIFWAGGYNIISAGSLPAGTFHTVVLTADGSTVKCFRNGLIVGSYTQTASNSASYFHFGNGWNQSGPNDVAMGAIFNKTLSDQQALELSRNPWQLFAPQPRRIFAPSAAAAPAGLAAHPLFGGGAAANPLWGYVA